jgi:hypothetical protein
MTRDGILTRYRRLREVSKQHHAAVLDVIAPQGLRMKPLACLPFLSQWPDHAPER